MRLIHILHQLPVQVSVTYRHPAADYAALPPVDEHLEYTADAGLALKSPVASLRSLTPPRSPVKLPADDAGRQPPADLAPASRTLQQQQQQQQSVLSPRQRVSSFSSPSGRSRSRSSSFSLAAISTAGLNEQLDAIALTLGSGSPQQQQQQQQLSTPPATAIAWTADFSFSARSGHAALYSGLASLEHSHEAVYIGSLGKLTVNYAGAHHHHNQQAQQLSPISGAHEDHDKHVNVGGVWLTHAQRDDLVRQLWTNYRCIPVLSNEATERGHYDGYCKEVLWPLFHYNPSGNVSTTPKQQESWKAYKAVNEAFAQAAVDCYNKLTSAKTAATSATAAADDDDEETPAPLVWVHDYHFLLAPEMVRTQLPHANIGCFVHTPFPSSEVFRCLPHREELLKGMLGASLIGFQTYSYARHFISSCTRVLGLESTPTGVYKDTMGGSLVQVNIFPIGVDVEKVMEMCESQLVQAKINDLREIYGDRKVIVGSDELDQTKGVVQKLQAFDKFLQVYPEWVGKVVLVQLTQPVAITGAGHTKLETKVSELVSAINGRHGSISFTPVHHIHRDIDPVEYFALLSVADVCLITSTRDGMNTTSHDFVIAQHLPHLPMAVSEAMDGLQLLNTSTQQLSPAPSSPSAYPHCGALVLSEFTGTAGSLSAALLVNPWDILQVAQAIEEALEMPREERALRHQQLYDHVSNSTVQVWASSFVKILSEIAGAAQKSSLPVPLLDLATSRDRYRSAKKRLIMFDYDGTLTPIVKRPSDAVPSKRMLRLLEALCSDPQNTVYVISGRDQEFLERWLGHISHLGLSAEHGSFIRAPVSHSPKAPCPQWVNCTEGLDLSWKNDVADIFTYYTERTQGSFIEHKRASITWHYRQADPTYGAFQARECYNHLEDALLSKLPIEILVGKKNLEVRPVAVNKGETVKNLLKSAIVLETVMVDDAPSSSGDNDAAEATDAVEDIVSSTSSLRRSKSFGAGMVQRPRKLSTTPLVSTPETADLDMPAPRPRARTRTNSWVNFLKGGDTSTPAGPQAPRTLLKCDYDFVFCSGDDKTDEDMFKAMTSFTNMIATRNSATPSDLTCWSVSIGPSSKSTNAALRLPSPFELLDVVEGWLAAPKRL